MLIALKMLILHLLQSGNIYGIKCKYCIIIAAVLCKRLLLYKSWVAQEFNSLFNPMFF